MSLLDQIDKSNLPKHIAIIMDGNGRWAKEKGKLRLFGHQSGVQSVKDVVEGAVEAGISYITMYTFSTENWNRPRIEVTALMELLVSTIRKETLTLHKNGVRLNAIGDIKQLPARCLQELEEAMRLTAENDKCVLTLALSYSARWELTEAARRIAQEVKNNTLDINDINEDTLSKRLSTADLPDPELMIRTSGEYRISNYLLWQLAYAEFYFTPTLWPDFRKENLFEAILDYQKRERRFGKISEQI